MKVNSFKSAVVLIAVLSITTTLYAETNFYAYYTKVRHSATDYLGKYADIIVVLGEAKQLEFTRQTGYLPRWRTSAGTFMVDDLFPGRDQDYEFGYNYVRLIENKPEKIVVHWHYYNDIQTLKWANRELESLTPHGFLGVMHELYTITPDGRVERKVLEAKETRSNDWNNPEIKTNQTLVLKADGIEHSAVKWGRPDPFYPRPAVKGNPLKQVSGLPEPIRYWRFDEGMTPHEDLVEDEITEAECFIHGLMTVFKKGVSGTALAFDGYYSGVTIEWEDKEENEDKAEIKDAMSIEAWLALDVYPYNIAPIIHQSKGFGKEGYYFGIDAYGHLLFTVKGQTIKTSDKLPLYQWTHIASAVGDGEINLFVDGELKATGKFNGEIEIPATELTIGLNTEKERCTDCVRGPDQNLLFIYGIQGLIDEIKVYNKKLLPAQIQESFKTLLPSNRISDLAKAVLPGEVGVAKQFGAFYKTLQFHELWDNMWRVTDNADIVVKFDKNPCSVIYWRGTNYAANWVTDNNRWMADQSSEIFTKHGCSEHMADKQNRHSYARIVENTPARVVIHWRYPCVDVSYYCANRRNWSDEYHTIYPDGTAVRKVVWNKGYDSPGFQDIQFFTNPGEAALDVVDIQAMTLANLKGETFKMKWKKPNIIPKNKLEDACIQYLNSKSDYHVFAIYQGGELGAWGTHEQSKYTDDPFAGPWNHWPISFVPSDGRFAVAHDRVTHFALGANDAAPEYGSMVLYGFTNQDITMLVPLAKSWKNPPQVTAVDGLESFGYDKDQRAFVFKSLGQSMSFTINASDYQALVNPCFVIQKWSSDKKAGLKINGSSLKKGATFRQGIVRDTDGTQTLVIWLEEKAYKPVSFEISKP